MFQQVLVVKVLNVLGNIIFYCVTRWKRATAISLGYRVLMFCVLVI